MHVLFHGLTPSPELKRTLASHGIRISLNKSRLNLKPDLILVRVKTEIDLSTVEKFHRAYPTAWITTIVGDPELKDTQLYTTLLNCEAKRSVWHTDTWEPLIWFSIRELTQAQIFENELHQLQHEVEASHKNTEILVEKLERDLAIAEKIQEKLISTRFPTPPGVQIVTKYMPAPGLGGDYFDIFPIRGDNQIGILLVDSETHGLVAALLSVLLKLKTDDFKNHFDTALSFLKHLESELNGQDQLSLFFGILDRKTLEFKYASSGHITPILWRHAEPVLCSNPVPEVTLPLLPGDTLFLCTNGLFKILGNAKNLIELISKMPDPVPLNQLKNTLMGQIDAYRDENKIEDDITFIEIGIDPKTLVLKKLV